MSNNIKEIHKKVESYLKEKGNYYDEIQEDDDGNFICHRDYYYVNIENTLSDFNPFLFFSIKPIVANISFSNDYKEDGSLNYSQLVIVILSQHEEATEKRYVEAHNFIDKPYKFNYEQIYKFYDDFIGGRYPNNLNLIEQELRDFISEVELFNYEWD